MYVLLQQLFLLNPIPCRLAHPGGVQHALLCCHCQLKGFFLSLTYLLFFILTLLPLDTCFHIYLPYNTFFFFSDKLFWNGVR